MNAAAPTISERLRANLRAIVAMAERDAEALRAIDRLTGSRDNAATAAVLERIVELANSADAS